MLSPFPKIKFGDYNVFNCIGMKRIVCFRKYSLDIPMFKQWIVFGLSQTLILTHHIQLERRTKPHSKVKRYILVSISSSITTRFGNYTYCVGFLYPLFWRECKRVQTCLNFKGIEFGAFKSGIVKLFPNTKILNCGTIANPILNDVIRPFRIFISGHICKGYIVFPITLEHYGDFRGFYNYSLFTHIITKTSATVSCLYKVTLRDTASATELNTFRESVTNHLMQS